MLPMLSRDFEPVTYRIWRPLLRQLDEMLEQGEQKSSDFSPSYEMDETDNHYVMSFDVPGVHRDDLSIEVTGNLLVVAGERKAEGRSNYRRYGKFQQLFTLPEGVKAEDVVAEHKDGVLRLAIQKPAAAKATKIKIGNGAAADRNGGFFKSLIGDKKAKDAVEIKGASSKSEPAAMAN